MSTRVLMTVSALVMALSGAAAGFLPQELLGYVGAQATSAAVLLIQLLGALYLGFAALNWMSRGFIAGGIYGRPLTAANAIHFLVGAIALAKGAVAGRFPPDVTVVAVIYGILAAAFFRLIFTHPSGAPDAARPL